MKNNKSTTNSAPKDIKFATFYSENEDDILLEILIINLIHQGVTLNELIKPTDLIANKKDGEEMKTKITNTVLDFINLNPKYIYLLNQNDNASEFLNSLGFDF